MQPSYSASPRRRWPKVLLALVVVLASVWFGAWHYGSSRLQEVIEGWKQREARAGRVYNCGNLGIGGFPFGVEVRCAGAELQSNRPSLALNTKEIVVTAVLWRPTQVDSEFFAPLTISEPGRTETLVINWRTARSQLHGLPTAPERATIQIEAPSADRESGGAREQIFKAARAEINGRMLEGTMRQNPVIEIVLKAVEASAPGLHPAAARPVDADVTAVIRGLKDFSPKPWPARFRELQEAGGRIEIVNARLQQGDIIGVANGTLGLSPRGRLDGQLQLTVANLDKLLPALGLDKLLEPKAAPNKLDSALNALDRIAPGLGGVARRNAVPAIMASVNLMGRPAELEGKRAVMLPLRFNDGMALLGPLPLGPTPPLF
jgi:hypothetical protein